MLRGIAQFVMSGRRQAVTVAILFALVPLLHLLSGAVVALVTLRKGWQEGFLVLLWALLPALLHLYGGDASAVFLLLAALISGQVLRNTQSWQAALAVLTVLGIATQLSLVWQTGYLAQVTAMFEQMLAEGSTLQLPAADGSMATASAGELVALLMYFYGTWHMAVFVGCLALARHWQALLYNPGGFRQEFHSLRLDPRFGGLLLALLAAGEFGLEPFASWLPLFAVAPLVSGLALCHYVVAHRRMGASWLVLAYLLALLITPALVALGFIDSFLNLRKRLGPTASGADKPGDE
jgi:hypothetical protein